MDVIGNNISNVNTTGFKSSRVTFSDMLSQTLTGAAAPSDNRGGTNPKQIGLGSSVASVDLLFTNGSVQSTGKNTDLCISGNGLFVVKDNSGTYYTRDGAFEFDAAGNYVLPGSGLYVQGWMADNGTLTTTGGTTNIKIPAGKSMGSAQSETVNYTKNLNADTKGYEIASITVTYDDGTTKTVQNYPSYVEKIKLSGGIGEFTVDDSTELPLTTDDSVEGKVLFTETIKSITATTSGTVDLTLESDGTNPSKIEGLPQVTGLTSGTYAYNDKFTIEGEVQDKGVTTTGDGTEQTVLTIKLTGPAQVAGTVVTAYVPQPPGDFYDGMTVSYDLLIKQIDAATGAKVNCNSGKTYETIAADGTVTVDEKDEKYKYIGRPEDGIVTNVVDEAKYGTSVVLNTTDGGMYNVSAGKTYSSGAYYYPPTVTTATVYDSLGGAHSIPILFTKTEANTWTLSLPNDADPYVIEEADGTQTKVSLTSKTLTFDTSGRYTDGDGSLAVTYGNGAAAQTVSLNLASLTQYIGSSTINADTDGHAAGTLSSVSIDTSGIITGTYTNGVKQAEAQVALAQFNNAAGLTKTGDSLYQESNNSGTANVKTAGDLGITLTPSALEMSNVDMANEFSDMIVTQRGFQGNSKIITVSDEMLETLINMKR